MDRAEIGLTFKYRDRDEAKSWIDSHGNTTDAEVILDCVTAWDLDDEFSLENVRRLCKLYRRPLETSRAHTSANCSEFAGETEARRPGAAQAVSQGVRASNARTHHGRPGRR
ncbi:phage tail assembly chaperone [Lysobacter enzymogenes]|uniref:phage tail assembly chaperone n=1 Tax=Lysobacter enzymogenes TaxID=69 RepID=UPI001A965644|nr:hypothetical protein JHW38_00010 [Lysobacter enzymogenes]